jgi:Holliday junction resolvasome RuvABC endonuclease subunit
MNIGLDLSLTQTGVCTLDPTTSEIVDVRTIKPPKGSAKGVRRLSWFRSALTEYLSHYSPTGLAIEDYAMGARGKVFGIGELGGVARLVALDLNINTIMVAPTCLKKFATGKGNAGKDVVILNVYKRWGKEFPTNDETDAYVLSRMAEAQFSKNEGLTKGQLEAMSKTSPLFGKVTLNPRKRSRA